MNICPDCKNIFVQPLVCTTCGAQKLYDKTLLSTQEEVARFAMLYQREHRLNSTLINDNSLLKACNQDLLAQVKCMKEAIRPEYDRLRTLARKAGKRGKNETADELDARADAIDFGAAQS